LLSFHKVILPFLELKLALLNVIVSLLDIKLPLFEIEKIRYKKSNNSIANYNSSIAFTKNPIH